MNGNQRQVSISLIPRIRRPPIRAAHSLIMTLTDGTSFVTERSARTSAIGRPERLKKDGCHFPSCANVRVCAFHPQRPPNRFEFRVLTTGDKLSGFQMEFPPTS